MLDEKAKKIVSTIESIEPIKKTGVVIESLDSSSVTARMPLAGNANHIGMMYAGSLFAVGEMVLGLTYMHRFESNVMNPVCAGLNIRFRRPAMSDITVTATISDEEFNRIESETLAEGKSRFSAELELKDEKGIVVATATVDYVSLKA
jgi:thioesterase domain-containing protein